MTEPSVGAPRPLGKKTDHKKSGDTTAALRHVVYRELIDMLPPASIGQTHEFAANLALCREAFRITDLRRREREIKGILRRYAELKVSPDIAEVQAFRGATKLQIEKIFIDRFGESAFEDCRILWPANGERWVLNLPERCALYGYRNRFGFYTGILCQPLKQKDVYFLLSSAKFGGQKAIRLEQPDRDRFESFNEPAAFEPDLSNSNLKALTAQFQRSQAA